LRHRFVGLILIRLYIGMQQSSADDENADRKAGDKRKPSDPGPDDVENSYYYDDAHGYENFDPEDSGEDDKETDQ